MGDSITQAEISQASYRYPLWKMLIDAGIEFDFVGSMNTHLEIWNQGDPPQPEYKGGTFDPDHEGHFGWQIDEIVDGRNFGNGTGSGRLAQWMENYEFDIVLVHLGTNDAFSLQPNEQTADEFRALIDTLRDKNPHAVILLAKIMPISGSGPAARAVAGMAGMIPQLARELDTEQSPVIVADMFKDFDTEVLTYDGAHPNAAGEQELARRWFEAIERALPLVK